MFFAVLGETSVHQNDTEAPGARLHGWEAALASVKEIPVLIVDGGPIGMALALSFDTRASNALWLSEEMAPSPIQK